MIPAAELAAMRAEALASCDQTANVQRNTPTPDIWNNKVDSWGTVSGLSAMPVRVATPSTPLYQQIAVQLGVVQVWLVHFSNAADVREGDRLVVGSDTLRVHTITSPQSYRTLACAICSEVR
jgi:hypothetical protein